MIGHFPRKLRGSATDMAKRLVALWSEYRKHNSTFDPASDWQKRDAFRWICIQVGYGEGWANAFAGQSPGKNHIYLGDLAITLTTNDLLRWNHKPKALARAYGELYEYFYAHLPDQVGDLLEEYEKWRNWGAQE